MTAVLRTLSCIRYEHPPSHGKFVPSLTHAPGAWQWCPTVPAEDDRLVPVDLDLFATKDFVPRETSSLESKLVSQGCAAFFISGLVTLDPEVTEQERYNFMNAAKSVSYYIRVRILHLLF